MLHLFAFTEPSFTPGPAVLLAKVKYFDPGCSILKNLELFLIHVYYDIC